MTIRGQLDKLLGVTAHRMNEGEAEYLVRFLKDRLTQDQWDVLFNAIVRERHQVFAYYLRVKIIDPEEWKSVLKSILSRWDVKIDREGLVTFVKEVWSWGPDCKGIST